MSPRFLTISVLSLNLLTAPALLAEGDRPKHSPEEISRHFEEKARMAEQNGNKEAAELLRKMAVLKREAAEAERRGERFDWEKMRELNRKLEQAWQKKEGRNEGDKKPAECKPDRKPGQDFIDAAQRYREMAEKAKADGRERDAHLLYRLAEIKMQAAEAARNGKDFDWTEYHEIKARLESGREKKECPDRNDRPSCDKPEERREQPSAPGGIRVE